jgi:hypothetical protein
VTPACRTVGYEPAGGVAPRQIFGGKRWPIENWQGSSGEMIYRMREEIAVW